MTKAILAALAAIAISAPLLASPAAADSIDQRQSWQQHRIDQARRSGELNRREYRELKHEQLRIAEMERRAKADGHLSYHERRIISRAQNQASRHIYQESHDNQNAWYRKWKYYR